MEWLCTSFGAMWSTWRGAIVGRMKVWPEKSMEALVVMGVYFCVDVSIYGEKRCPARACDAGIGGRGYSVWLGCLECGEDVVER